MITLDLNETEKVGSFDELLTVLKAYYSKSTLVLNHFL